MTQQSAVAEGLRSAATGNNDGVTNEVRMTDSKTGGQKGVKLARFDLIPAEPHRWLALVYGVGAQKYSEDNWRKGYPWRWSIGALERHLNAFKRGEIFDPELTELAGEPVPHLAAVAWHAYGLMEFAHRGLGTDDVPEHGYIRTQEAQ